MKVCIQWVVLISYALVLALVSADLNGIVNVVIWVVLLVLGVTVFPFWLSQE